MMLDAKSSVFGAMADAEARVKAMEDTDSYYFEADKVELQRESLKVVDALIDAAFYDPNSPRNCKARGVYLKGRAASLVEGQEARALELLSKAVKLEPQWVEAWNAIGEVHWNMQRYALAKDCFEQCIKICGPNPTSLRGLSMVLRAIDSSGGDAMKAARAQNYAEAVVKAKEAVALDANDPQNWETLGNAYFGDFFVSSHRPDDMNRTLVAYSKAEALYEKSGRNSVSLELNRGKAAKYVEDYDLALRSFRKARSLGAALAEIEEQSVLSLLRRVTDYVERRGEIKAKRIRELVADVAHPGEQRTLAELQAGDNSNLPLAARVITVLDRQEEMPVVVICCDAKGDCFALSVYGAQQAKIAESLLPQKSVLHIKQPKLHHVSVKDSSGKPFSYVCVRVSQPSDVVVIGSGPLQGAAMPQFSTSSKRVSSNLAAPQGISKVSPGIGASIDVCRESRACRARGGKAISEVWKLDPEISRWIQREDAMKRKAAKTKALSKIKRCAETSQADNHEQAICYDHHDISEGEREHENQEQQVVNGAPECGADDVDVSVKKAENSYNYEQGQKNCSEDTIELIVGCEPGCVTSSHGGTACAAADGPQGEDVLTENAAKLRGCPSASKVILPTPKPESSQYFAETTCEEDTASTADSQEHAGSSEAGGNKENYEAPTRTASVCSVATTTPVKRLRWSDLDYNSDDEEEIIFGMS